MNNIKILWVDDEIEFLKSQILFLEDKGYTVDAVSNGHDAIDACKQTIYDIVFLDEHMPGITGLETLAKLKEAHSDLPIVMITKSEEENIMEEAIGSQIADYLIKPVNPNQILLSLKKIIDNKRLVKEKTTSGYQQDFQNIFAALGNDMTTKEWSELYQKLVYWEVEMDKSSSNDMQEVLTMQKQEANVEFSKFVTKNYFDWINQNTDDTPIMSDNLMQSLVFEHISDDTPIFFILIDNLRYDQFKIIQPLIQESFQMDSEEIFYSILPTTTQYSRNAIFAGLMPSEIEENYPDLWVNDEDEGGRNLHEETLFKHQIERLKLGTSISYTKITNHNNGKKLEDNVLNLMNNQLNVIVYNFVDMLSHARTEMEVLKELASDERAYRSLCLSWFKHSPLHNALLKLSDKKVKIIITTDHGMVKVSQPSKVIADKKTTTNIRYKTGKNLNYEDKDVYVVNNPHDIFLPKQHMSSKFIFAKEDKYLVYPNNYNHFVNYFKNTFQHGGISMEEMMIPFAIFNNK